jgi:hypothetical protein
LARGPNDPPPLVAPDSSGRRSKIWDIVPWLHCSIVGTCLSAAELRQLFLKAGEADAKAASDNVLHANGVRAAGSHGFLGKLLNKTLDKRHEATIRRFAKASSPARLRELWLEAFEQGNIPGGYWAVLTHPAADRPLIEEAFGQVHMLSHMVGSSNRIDITRLRALERQIGERDEKVLRQEARLAENSRDRADLLRKVESLEAEVRRRQIAEQTTAKMVSNADASSTLLQQLNAEKNHSDRLAARVADLESEAKKAHTFAAALNKQNEQLQREVSALEVELRTDKTDERAAEVGKALDGLTVLYVGGRPSLVEHLRAVVTTRGGILLWHDGGIEENIATLPGLISQADAAFFPIDCISHCAVGQIKKSCRDGQKRIVPLRTASVASFIAAIRDRGLFQSEAIARQREWPAVSAERI